jgi:signal transduction histidine kinase
MPRLLRRAGLAAAAGPYTQWAVDATIALALTAVSLQVGLSQPPPQWRHLDTVGIVLTCAVNLVTVVRRPLPFTVLLVCSAEWAGYVSLGYWPVVNSLAPMLMVYTVAALRPPRRAGVAAMLLSGVWIFATVRGQEGGVVTAVAQGVVFSGVLWRFGDSARKLTASNTALADTAEQLRLDQEARAREAVVLERARISRELHDVVAHHLSVVSVQAGLARYVLASDQETAGRALDTVLDSSSEALEELRRMLSLFRYSSFESYSPSAGLRELSALADRVRASGVDLEIRTTGRPYPLAPGTDLCAYRVVQESLTNILKHAPGAKAEIAVDYGAERLTIRVSNDSSAAGQGAGTGNGLLGMRERARVYGGTLQAGPQPHGGFVVLLTLPVAGGADRHPGESPDS